VVGPTDSLVEATMIAIAIVIVILAIVGYGFYASGFLGEVCDDIANGDLG